ncbi:MAG TPA: nucleotide exchange factor GrpE [Conexibacter sp.]|nr:nucleotide exchange factor GrpE [Conexibacter sp.]
MTAKHDSQAAPAEEAGATGAAAPEPVEQVDGVHATADALAPDDGAAEVEHDLDELLVRADKADEYLALAQRTQADFENFRKRMTRDVAAAEARGVGRLARELLPALDNLGRALAAAEAGGEHGTPEHHLTSGIKLVHDELLAALARVGIEPFSPAGERFDPNEHEAISQQPVEGAEAGTVVEVYQQGFRHEGSVLRPARVVVAA